MAKINLTPGRIATLQCDSGQAFLGDATVPGLGLRGTPGGKKISIIQSRFDGKAIRITINDVGGIILEGARNEARRIMLLIEQGIDPREHKRQLLVDQAAAKIDRKQGLCVLPPKRGRWKV